MAAVGGVDIAEAVRIAPKGLAAALKNRGAELYEEDAGYRRGNEKNGGGG